MNPNEMRTRFHNLTQLKAKDWYRVVNQAVGPTQIHIYDDIGLMGVSSQDLVDDLAQINGPVELRLNSGGGEIFEGIAIYNALCSRDVAIYIDGIAASAASFIAMAASPGKLFMAKNASMMIHDGQAMAIGNSQELTALVGVLERESDKISSIYAERTGKKSSYFRDKMRKETWYNAAEAFAEGLVDVVFDPRTNSPVDMTNKIVNTAGDKQLGSGWVCGADGKDRFDPDGDGDDDSTPEGDTDHDYFDENGNQLKPVPPMPKHNHGMKSGKQKKKLKNDSSDFDNSPWDADKAWANGAASSDPASFYSGICAGKKSGDPKTQGAHALPYKYHPGDKPNAAAVRNALSRLPQTEGLTNEAEARSTLENLMKKINPDYQPGNSADTTFLAQFMLDALKKGEK